MARQAAPNKTCQSDWELATLTGLGALFLLLDATLGDKSTPGKMEIYVFT